MPTDFGTNNQLWRRLIRLEDGQRNLEDVLQKMYETTGGSMNMFVLKNLGHLIKLRLRKQFEGMSQS